MAFCSVWVKVGGESVGMAASCVHWHGAACCGEVKGNLMDAFGTTAKVWTRECGVSA
jgi:hypothetical protein